MRSGLATSPRPELNPALLMSHNRQKQIERLREIANEQNNSPRLKKHMSYGVKIASMSHNYMTGLAEKELGFNKKKFFSKNDTRGLQTRVGLNMLSAPVNADKEDYDNHHHYSFGVRKQQRFFKGPDIPMNTETIRMLEEKLRFVRDKEAQRQRHRNVQNESPFKVGNDVRKQIMLESVDFSI